MIEVLVVTQRRQINIALDDYDELTPAAAREATKAAFGRLVCTTVSDSDGKMYRVTPRSTRRYYETGRNWWAGR
jgi:hypothetical protein